MQHATHRILFFAATLALAPACADLGTEPSAEPPAEMSPQASPSAVAATVEPAASASSKPIRSVYEWVTDFTDGNTYWTIRCDGQESEPIRMDGIIRHRMTIMEAPDGRFQARHQTTAHRLRGVGLYSGTEYRARSQIRSITNEVNKATTNTHRSVTELVDRKSGHGFRQVLITKYTINANGEVTMDREEEHYECSL